MNRPKGMFVKYIQQETGTRVQIKGQGSGFVDQETGKESEEPMHIHITCVSSLERLELF
jgi:KH domain-containing protein